MDDDNGHSNGNANGNRATATVTPTITMNNSNERTKTNKTATAQQLINACQRQFAKCQTLNKNYRNKHNVLATDLWHNNHNHSISRAHGDLALE